MKARYRLTPGFASLAHYITQDRVWMNLWKIPSNSTAGVDDQSVHVLPWATRASEKVALFCQNATDALVDDDGTTILEIALAVEFNRTLNFAIERAFGQGGQIFFWI